MIDGCKNKKKADTGLVSAFFCGGQIQLGLNALMALVCFYGFTAVIAVGVNNKHIAYNVTAFANVRQATGLAIELRVFVSVVLGAMRSVDTSE